MMNSFVIISFSTRYQNLRTDCLSDLRETFAKNANVKKEIASNVAIKTKQRGQISNKHCFIVFSDLTDILLSYCKVTFNYHYVGLDLYLITVHTNL